MLDLKQREVYGMKRETFGSRLGFILVSAGCAVGIGNVWKFPYMCGQFGGAAFILIYLVFLLIMGIPVMVCEFGVGRASRHSVAAAYEILDDSDLYHWIRCMCIWNPERYRKSIQVHDDSIAFDHDRTCDPLCDDERCRSGNPLLSDS